MMLVLAALLGTALSPVTSEAYPETSSNLLAAFNMLTMIISCACLAGTTSLVLETALVEGTPAQRIHSIIAKADGLFEFGTNMMALGLQGTAPVVVLRAWIGGFSQTQCIILTAIGFVFQFGNNFVYFKHLQQHWPVAAQRWTKLFMPALYREEMSHTAVDELVDELRYLQQPQDKTLSSEQLGICLDKYFASISALSSADEGVLLADQTEFLQLLEDEADGRLAPTMERLARITFDKVIQGKLEQLADDAINHRSAS